MPFLSPWLFKRHTYPFLYFFPHNFFAYHPSSPRQQILKNLKSLDTYTPGLQVILGEKGCGKLFITLAAWADSPLNCHNFLYFDNPSIFLRYLQSGKVNSQEIYFLYIEDLSQLPLFKSRLDLSSQQVYLSLATPKSETTSTLKALTGTFYRHELNQILIIPRLAETPEDVDYILRAYSENLEQPILVEEEVFEWFRQSAWPGNFRDLFDTMQTMFEAASSQGLHSVNLEFCQNFRNEVPSYHRCQFIESLSRSPRLWRELKTPQYADLLAQFEQVLLAKALDESQGIKRRAANALGIPPTTLISRLEKHAWVEGDFKTWI